MRSRLPDFAASRAVLIGTARYLGTALIDLPAVENNLADLHGLLMGEAAELYLATTGTVAEQPWTCPGRLMRSCQPTRAPAGHRGGERPTAARRPLPHSLPASQASPSPGSAPRQRSGLRRTALLGSRRFRSTAEYSPS